jgi:hypothetical protein
VTSPRGCPVAIARSTHIGCALCAGHTWDSLPLGDSDIQGPRLSLNPQHSLSLGVSQRGYARHPVSLSLIHSHSLRLSLPPSLFSLSHGARHARRADFGEAYGWKAVALGMPGHAATVAPAFEYRSSTTSISLRLKKRASSSTRPPCVVRPVPRPPPPPPCSTCDP